MHKYDVRVFILHSFVAAPLTLRQGLYIEPFPGTGAMDVMQLMDLYILNRLNQPIQPAQMKEAASRSIAENGSTVVVTFEEVPGEDHTAAIQSTEEMLLLCRDVLALRQLQRGVIGGFLSIDRNVSPPSLYAHVRPPYPVLRKVRNLPFGETEQDVFSSLLGRAMSDLLLRTYLRLYADSVAYSDTLIDELDLETRLFKIWSLLESMAADEPGTKKSKVRSLFRRYEVSTMSNYKGSAGKDLLDVAYTWRNIIVHNGTCRAAIAEADRQFCANFHDEFKAIVEDLSQSCRFLIHAYAKSRQ